MFSREIFFENKVFFISLGCARNLVDSEVMIGILLRAGYEICPALEEADFIVINTCGFLESARQEGIETIEEAFHRKKKGAKVIAAGCMVQKMPEELRSRFPKLHYMLGSGDAEKILEAIRANHPGANVSDAKSYLEWGEVPRVLSTPNSYAYLKIAEGCKKRCSYCIIPSIKGVLKSKPKKQVLKEFRSLLSQGVFEIILIAQDLGDYGKDRLEKGALAFLLEEILAIKGDFWLRLLYLYPDEIEKEIVQLMQKDKRICPYLDMPIQHIDDGILRAMHRKTSRKQILDTIAMLRKQIPDISIRTSLMVGFPGESEEQFEELVAFVKSAELDQVGIFAFSWEKQAFAARLPDQIDEETKKRRALILAKAQREVVEKKGKEKVGKKLIGIVEGYHPESELLFRARYQGQCPDIDGQIIINDGGLVDSFGALYEIEITGTSGYDLIGRVVAKCKKRSKKLTLV